MSRVRTAQPLARCGTTDVQRVPLRPGARGNQARHGGEVSGLRREVEDPGAALTERGGDPNAAAMSSGRSKTETPRGVVLVDRGEASL